MNVVDPVNGDPLYRRVFKATNAQNRKAMLDPTRSLETAMR